MEKIKTHIYKFSNLFFFENRAVYENVEKYCGAGQATDDSMYLRCMLDTYGYKHIFRICATYCFCPAKMVVGMRLSVA